MELKPGYKQTEVGVIPADWDQTFLGDKTVKVGSGITPTGGARVYRQSGHPFLRSQNIGWGTLLMDDVAFIDDQTHESFNATEIAVGDVFLNITGASIGRSAVADARVRGGNVNQHVCIIRPKNEELDAHFLNYFLLSPAGQRQIDSFQAGGNRQGLNFGQIRAFRLPLPVPAEQVAIVAALSDTDALLTALDQLIAKKRDLRHAAMQQLLTGKQRLPRFCGEWEVKRLGEIAALRKEHVDPRKAGIQNFCVELEHMEQGSGRLVGSSNAADQSSVKSVFQAGDVLFGKLRAYLRKYWLADQQGVCSTEIWVLAGNLRLVTPQFLFYLVAADQFIEAANNSYGTHMPRSDWNVVKNYEIVLPTLEEQRAIATVLTDIDAEIAALEQHRDKVRAIKQAMMQELLTGKIRLV